MKKIAIWGVGILLALILFLVCTLFFVFVFQEISNRRQIAKGPPVALAVTPTPNPTSVILVENTATELPPAVDTATVTPTAIPVVDTPTATLLPPPITFTPTPAPVNPQVTAPNTVNMRAGPGTNYPVVGTLTAGISLPIVGKNDDGSWWHVHQTDGSVGWVAASVVETNTSDISGVPIVQAPPPPVIPTATSEPAISTPRPQHQFEPTGWYDDTNRGLTRFLGTINDVNGSPVNGVTVEARCGTYAIISNPSGPVGGFASNDSADDPPGFYDITVDKRPIPCTWLLTVVYTEDGKNVLSVLSEHIEIETTVDKSIITANWRKNW